MAGDSSSESGDVSSESGTTDNRSFLERITSYFSDFSSELGNRLIGGDFSNTDYSTILNNAMSKGTTSSESGDASSSSDGTTGSYTGTTPNGVQASSISNDHKKFISTIGGIAQDEAKSRKSSGKPWGQNRNLANTWISRFSRRKLLIASHWTKTCV